MMISWIILIIFIAPVFYFDIKQQKIPNILSVMGILTGFLFHLFQSSWQGLLFSIFGMCIGFILLFFMYLFKAIGAGDVKLFAAIGAIVGTKFVLYSIMYSIIYAAIIGIFIMIWRKEVFQRVYHIWSTIFFMSKIKSHQHYQFPFMYAVVPAVITTAYYAF